VPISGRSPASASDSITITNPSLSPTSADFDVTAAGPGRARFFLWGGDHGNIPVFSTSCALADDPAPDYGMTPCAITDGGIPQWSPDMSGRVIRRLVVAVSSGTQHLSIPLDASAYAKLSAVGSALVSFAAVDGGGQAFDIPLARATLTLGQSSATSNLNDPVTLTADVTGALPFPGTPSGQVQFQVDGTALGSPVGLDSSGHASLVTTALPPGTHSLTFKYLGDADYAPGTSASLDHLTKGVVAQLADLHTLIGGFGLGKGLANDLQRKVTEAETRLAQGQDACPKLNDLMRMALDHAGKGAGELSFDETVQLLDASNSIEVLLGCVPASSPNPKAEDDLVALMSTIDGMSLSGGEANALTNKARDAAKQLVGGQGAQACQTLAALSTKIANDTGKKNGLTASQAATLTAAVSQISSDLGC
jgi:hypothetical protein